MNIGNSTIPGYAMLGRNGGAAAARIFGTAAAGAANFMTGGASGIFTSMMGGLGGGVGADGADRFSQLIAQQMQVQAEMQVFSSRSNIEKTRHDTAMTAIRNMRA